MLMMFTQNVLTLLYVHIFYNYTHLIEHISWNDYALSDLKEYNIIIIEFLVMYMYTV